VLGAPALVSGTAFRVVHLQHHQYNRSEADPDEISSAVPNARLRQVAFYGWLLVGMFYYVLVRLPIQAWRLGSWQERRQMVVEYGLLIAIYATVFTVAASQGAVWSVLHAWIFPAVFTGLFANVRGAAEHMLTEPGHPLTQSRTVRSTRLLSFLNVNLNYHLDHHLFPGIPWYNLPEVHELLQEEYEEAGSFVYGSYLRFIVEALRTGVHGVARSAR
jgi:fatty acid desaturase